MRARKYLQQDSTVSVDIGPGVLCLAVLRENSRGHLKQVAHELEHGVLGEVLQGKTTLADVAGIRLPQHSVPVTRDNLNKEWHIRRLQIVIGFGERDHLEWTFWYQIEAGYAENRMGFESNQYISHL